MKTAMKVGLVWMALAVPAAAGEAQNWKKQLPPVERVPAYLQEISVMIQASNASGSGVIKTRIIDGQKVSFVWTAAHVVANLRTTEEIVDPTTGTKRTAVRYSDAQIVKELVEDGRKVGEFRMNARVIRVNKDEDLALLRLRKRAITETSCVFYLDTDIPPLGTRLLHVGSLLGQTGANSMTSGIVSQIGRVLNDNGVELEYDQTTVTAFPGSSGGGVYLENGAYIGMLVRGAGEQFNLIIPVRRMVRWAKSAKVYWALDDSAPVPTEAELERLPIEDVGQMWKGAGPADPAKPVPVKTLIWQGTWNGVDSRIGVSGKAGSAMALDIGDGSD